MKTSMENFLHCFPWFRLLGSPELIISIAEDRWVLRSNFYVDLTSIQWHVSIYNRYRSRMNVSCIWTMMFVILRVQSDPESSTERWYVNRYHTYAVQRWLCGVFLLDVLHRSTTLIRLNSYLHLCPPLTLIYIYTWKRIYITTVTTSVADGHISGFVYILIRVESCTLSFSKVFDLDTYLWKYILPVDPLSLWCDQQIVDWVLRPSLGVYPHGKFPGVASSTISPFWERWRFIFGSGLTVWAQAPLVRVRSAGKRGVTSQPTELQLKATCRPQSQHSKPAWPAGRPGGTTMQWYLWYTLFQEVVIRGSHMPGGSYGRIVINSGMHSFGKIPILSSRPHNVPTSYVRLYTGYFREHHWISMGLQEISRALSQYKDHFFRYGDSHVKDKTVARPSYL